MISLVTPFEYSLLMIGLLGSVLFGVIVGVGSVVWSSLKKRGK